MFVDKYESNSRKSVNFIKKYTGAKNASSGSEVDANANVETKNITTMGTEIHKKDNIYTNRLMMHDKLKELFDLDIAEEYLRQLETHEIYRHDEAGAIIGTPYCASISMYPFLLNGLKGLGGKSGAPKHLRSFCGGFINLVFAISSQLAGACSTPEFISYLDYFIRKEYGNDYYLNENKSINSMGDIRTIGDVINACFDQVVYSINQPAAARGYQCVTEDTELWTPTGFKHLNELKVGDICYVWKDGKFLEEKINKLNTYDYNGELFQFHGQNYKQTVTPNHRVLYKKCNTNDYNIKEAKELVGHSKLSLPVSGNIDRPDYPISDEQLKLCVYALTDGSIDNNRLNFYMSKNRSGYNDLISSLNSLGVGYTEYNKKQLFGNVSTIRLASIDAATTLRFIKHTKLEIPHFFKLLSKRQAELVINCWGNTDGSIRNGKYLLQCDSMEIAKNLQEVVLLSGRGSTIKTETGKKIIKNESCQTIYVSTFNRNTKRISSYNSVIYSGRVWCPTTNAGIVVFREDNNTPYISGNSVFWNNAYFDKYYFEQLFGEFVFPDGTKMPWDSVNWLQKRFITWFNNERTKEILTFPVESASLLDDGKDFVDKEWKDFIAEMYAKGHSFFTYRSNSVDSLSSCCRLRNEFADNTFSYTLGAGGVATGSKCVMTININRLVQNAVKDEIEIKTAVRNQVEKIHKYLIAFNEILKEMQSLHMIQIYDAGFIDPKKQYLTIGINGLVEGAEFLGIEISPNKKYEEYVNSIFETIYKLNREHKTNEIMFNTEQVPAENLGIKNAKWDREDGYFVPRDCYNSYIYLVEDEKTNVLDKFIMHGEKFTSKLDGGCALHVNLEEHLSKEQYTKLLENAIKTGCSYFTFNIPNTICKDCGYISKNKLKTCSKCGSSNLDYATRIIGYLKMISSFSEGRQSEEEKRVYH